MTRRCLFLFVLLLVFSPAFCKTNPKANLNQTLPNLIKANLGESLVIDGRVSFMRALADATPPLQLDNPQQIVALPLGSRVKLDPWAVS